MLNQAIIIKVQNLLNKLDSSDYGNIEYWQIIEAFNIFQSDWVRETLAGYDKTKTGAEGSIVRIDDLQFLLTTAPVIMTDLGIYWSGSLPDNYRQWSRISAKGKDCCCPPIPLIIFLGEDADLDINLSDDNRKPTLKWKTTFVTISSNKVNIYTNDEFDIEDTVLSYYRNPVGIQVAGQADSSTGTIATADVLCEAPDNVIEIFIKGAAALLVGDMDNYNQLTRLTNSVTQTT